MAQAERGNRLCFGGCPEATRVLIADGAIAEWKVRLDAAIAAIGLDHSGWEAGPDGAQTAKARAGGLDLAITISSRSVRADGSVRRVREGRVGLEITARGHRRLWSGPSSM